MLRLLLRVDQGKWAGNRVEALLALGGDQKRAAGGGDGGCCWLLLVLNVHCVCDEREGGGWVNVCSV